MRLAFSADGSQLAIPFGAILSESDGVEARDVRSGERLARLPVDGAVRTVAFSPDGGLLAGGQMDGTALLWATDGWRRVGALPALGESAALAVAFSPDGRTLATADADGAVVLWDVASQRPVSSPLETRSERLRSLPQMPVLARAVTQFGPAFDIQDRPTSNRHRYRDSNPGFRTENPAS